MQSLNGEVVIKDVPYGLWIFGLVFGGIGAVIGFASGAPVFIPIIFSGVGLLLVLFTPILTISVDRNSGVLTMRRTGILVRSQQEYRIDQIVDVYVSRKVSTDSDGTSTTYQVIMLLDNGDTVPLRKYSSSGHRGKAKQVKLLKDALDLTDRPAPNRFKIGRTPQELQQSFQAEQLETADISAGEQETDGVTWELQIRTFGTMPVTRWFSPEIETQDYFVYIAQKQEGQGAQKSFMYLLGKALFKQSLRIYGFDSSYTPGLEDAVVFQEGDGRLMNDYFIFASAERDAHRILNPWVVTPLVAWADRHPLDKTGQQYSQMTVLFSPWGLFISVMGSLNKQEVEEITDLGIELVKSSTV